MKKKPDLDPETAKSGPSHGPSGATGARNVCLQFHVQLGTNVADAREVWPAGRYKTALPTPSAACTGGGLAAPATLNSPDDPLESINVKAGLIHPPSTLPNLYETPHTSERAAATTLTPPAQHALAFIRDPLLKAAQEFLMYFNFSATAVAQPSKPCNNTQAVKSPPSAPQLPADSIKLAANNGQSCLSIGRFFFCFFFLYWIVRAE